jgi:hypothetical protein
LKSYPFASTWSFILTCILQLIEYSARIKWWKERFDQQDQRPALIDRLSDLHQLTVGAIGDRALQFQRLMGFNEKEQGTSCKEKAKG